MRMRRIILLLVAAVALVGCAEVLDELGISMDDLGLSPEDQEAFEDMMEGLAEAANNAANSDSDGDGGGPSNDPNWSPEGMPPPPVEPNTSGDASDTEYCDPGWSCGMAAYPPEHDQAIRDHYEDVFGRPPDRELEQGPNDYAAWEDGDAKVSVGSTDGDTVVWVHVEN
jgi:hypothetical protein